MPLGIVAYAFMLLLDNFPRNSCMWRNENNTLHKLLPNTCSQPYHLRRRRKFTLPFAITKGFAGKVKVNSATSLEGPSGRRLSPVSVA